MDGFDRVTRELGLYEHPFFELSTEENGDLVVVCVRSRVAGVHSPEYRFTLTAREVEHPQFRWSFQGLLFGSLNDYMVELFTRTPEATDPDS